MVDVADRIQRFDHRDDQPLFVIGWAAVADRIDNGTGLVGGIDHRHHQAVRAGIEIADQHRTLVRIRPHDRGVTSATNDLGRNAYVLKAP